MADTAPIKPDEFLLKIEIDEDDGYVIVSDFLGLRYGGGETIPKAVNEWSRNVEWICAQPLETFGEPLLSEAKAYRCALRREESNE